MLELTGGFETNILINSNRKDAKYNSLIKDLYTQFRTVHFISLSIGALGILGTSSPTFQTMLEQLEMDKAVQRKLIMEIMNITIRNTYFVFCRKNKECTNPDLLDF